MCPPSHAPSVAPIGAIEGVYLRWGGAVSSEAAPVIRPSRRRPRPRRPRRATLAAATLAAALAAAALAAPLPAALAAAALAAALAAPPLDPAALAPAHAAATQQRVGRDKDPYVYRVCTHGVFFVSNGL